MQNSSKIIHTVLFLGIPLLIFGGIGGYYIGVRKNIPPLTPTPIIQNKNGGCTQDALLCPDGSKVVRVGPKCEYAPCPTTELTKPPEQNTPTKPTQDLTPSSRSFPKPDITPPAQFGYTKLIDLPGIGVRASFPESTKITYYDPAVAYHATLSIGDSVSFELREYSGGGRREWFRTYIGHPESIFESYSANNHSGYISYLKDSKGKVINAFYYITVVSQNKILLISAQGSPSNYFFGASMDKFRSFLSTVHIFQPNPQGVERGDQKKIESTVRTSETRKTVWEDMNLGLRLTAPEWIESKPLKKIRENGTWEYGEWERSYAQVIRSTINSLAGELDSIFISTVYQVPRASISFLPSQFTGKTHKEIAEDLLISSGGCGMYLQEYKSECSNQDQYCYTRNDVLRNLLLIKTANFGPYIGELRGIRADFEQKMDCRHTPEWLIQVKGGKFVTTTINPDDDLVRLEAI